MSTVEIDSRMMAMGEEDLVRVSFDAAKLKALAFGDRPYRNRVSFALALRVLTTVPHELAEILSEIDILEGHTTKHSRTKPPTAFKNSLLSKFQKKHFSTPRHYIKNVGVRWNLDRGGNKDLSNAIMQVAAEHGEQVDNWPKKLADRIYGEGYLERIGRLTGDWIVFAEFNGSKYYLDLAQHGEVDDHLYAKLVAGNRSEYPFLFDEPGICL